MLQEAKEMLNLLDIFLCPGTPAAIQVWEVLTALRGPDFGDGVKWETTARIRARAFPITTKRIHESPMTFHQIPAAFNDDGLPIESGATCGLHFSSHVAYARGVLA